MELIFDTHAQYDDAAFQEDREEILSGLSEPDIKVKGLGYGADDYLTKPFGMMEMIARIKAVLRRSMPKEELNVLLAGKLELNLNEHTVTVSGKRVQLTLKEFEMLRLFMEHIGRVYTRDQLLSKIWGADYIGETRTVDVHIRTLRSISGFDVSEITIFFFKFQYYMFIFILMEDSR